MRKRLAVLLSITAALVLAILLGQRLRSVQAANDKSGPSFAAVPGSIGGQDMFGAYDVVPDWPKPLSTIPGNEKWTWGAGQSVFAESPNRVFILQRGELPNIERPKRIKLPQLGPSIEFPIGRLPWRDATSASPPGRLETPDGKLGDDSDVGKERRGLQLGALHRGGGRQRQPHRGLDPVGQDVAAASLRLHQPLRSGKARLDCGRLPARHFHFHQRWEEAAANHRRAQRARFRRQALLPADVHRVASRRHLLRRRRVREHACRQIRQERKIPDGVGRERQSSE